MSGQWSKHDFISIQKSVSSLWLGDCSNFRTLSKNLCCQAQIALLLTVRRSWCQCQIWQKRRCATTTSAGDLGNGNTKGPNDWRLWNQVDHGYHGLRLWFICFSMVKSRSAIRLENRLETLPGDATIPRASSRMALGSSVLFGPIPCGQWRLESKLGGRWSPR